MYNKVSHIKQWLTYFGPPGNQNFEKINLLILNKPEKIAYTKKNSFIEYKTKFNHSCGLLILVLNKGLQKCKKKTQNFYQCKNRKHGKLNIA